MGADGRMKRRSTLLEDAWNVGKGNEKTKPAGRKWRESFTVWIDFIGDRSQVGPLLDHIAGCASDGGGSFVAVPLCDQSWDFVASNAVTAKVAGDRALDVFERLKAACRARWAPYVCLRMLHDDKPERCTRGVTFTRRRKNGRIGTTFRRVKHDLPVRGPLVLRKYQRGKYPGLSKVFRPRAKRRKARNT